ncbi:ORF5 [Spodoptera eridania nucleopolyhedrovirus]|uniref:ORF5 n=1 Tax=Spodoptera eridania nucleopolyhedrovirus TaxID=2315721 RepID=A0A346TPU3_9ABAC|nr:ORF5 [Spodoptera eridania nucleopolyhedrovirus]AXU41603.1 ORF5 [Spodoptera eridania nucleopolyhedrovirus]
MGLYIIGTMPDILADYIYTWKSIVRLTSVAIEIATRAPCILSRRPRRRRRSAE